MDSYWSDPSHMSTQPVVSPYTEILKQPLCDVGNEDILYTLNNGKQFVTAYTDILEQLPSSVTNGGVYTLNHGIGDESTSIFTDSNQPLTLLEQTAADVTSEGTYSLADEILNVENLNYVSSLPVIDYVDIFGQLMGPNAANNDIDTAILTKEIIGGSVNLHTKILEKQPISAGNEASIYTLPKERVGKTVTSYLSSVPILDNYAEVFEQLGSTVANEDIYALRKKLIGLDEHGSNYENYQSVTPLTKVLEEPASNVTSNEDTHMYTLTEEIVDDAVSNYVNSLPATDYMEVFRQPRASAINKGTRKLNEKTLDRDSSICENNQALTSYAEIFAQLTSSATNEGVYGLANEILNEPGPSCIPHIELIEQPASISTRFRYACESRSAASIPGIRSTHLNRTFPKIRILGYSEPVTIQVSCVTKDAPHKAHPHKLVKENCADGIYRVTVFNKDMTQTFPNLGIQCTKKRNIEKALTEREERGVDPFAQGFDHKHSPNEIDSNVVRLCFQAFIPIAGTDSWCELTTPVVSEPVYNRKTVSDLNIIKLSHTCGSVKGGLDMILLCQKVVKGDLKIRFREEVNGRVLWKGKVEFSPDSVHKQFAIAFKTPPYRTTHIDKKVEVQVYLKRPSDGLKSKPVPFFYQPDSAYRFEDLKYELFPHLYNHTSVPKTCQLGYPVLEKPINVQKSTSISDETVNVSELTNNTFVNPDQRCSIELALNTEELAQISNLDIANLCENLSSSMSISDEVQPHCSLMSISDGI